jgi:large subunit ribosomal protein L9
MKIIYIKNTPKGGKIGEIKEVSNGYAQNFLIPQKIAIQATKQNIYKTQKSRQKKEKDSIVNIKKTKNLTKQLAGVEIRLKEKANEKGTLFAAISEKEICRKLEKQDIKINYKNLKLSKHIKEIGEHEVEAELNHSAPIKIKIIIEKI